MGLRTIDDRRKTRLLPLILVILIFSLFLFVPSAVAAGRVVIFVIDRMSIYDIDQLPLANLKSMVRGGSVGLFSAKVVGRTIPESSFLTLGSSGKSSGDGEKVFGVPYGALAFNKGEILDGERVEELYRQLNGRSPGSSPVMNIAVSGITQQNLQSREGSVTGLLGKILKERGYKTAVFGNSDVLDQKHREIAAVLMDEKGLVEGNVGEDLIRCDSSFPGGIRTDEVKLFQEVHRALKRFDVIAVDWGDLSRIEDINEMLAQPVYDKSRLVSLVKADRFLGKLLALKDRPDIVVISPTPPDKAILSGDYFSPVVVLAPGQKGLLTSISTRRVGIVTNTDFPATVLNLLGIEKDADMRGEPMTSVAAANPVKELISIDYRAVTTDQVRRLVLPAFVLWYAIVTLILLRLFLFEKKKSYWIGRFLLLVTMSMPLVLLMVPTFGIIPIPLSIALVVLLMLGIGFISVFSTKSVIEPIYIISLATAALIIVDTFTSGYLIKNSILSYCPIAGFRYYGIGNEYMGVLIATTLVSVVGLLGVFDKGQRWVKISVSTIPLIFVVVVLALPSLGTNFGGAAAALVGFVYFALIIMGVRVGWREWALICLILALSIAAMLALNALFPANDQSHIGRSVALISKMNTAPLLKMVSRKISMNLRTTARLFWNWVVFVSLIALGLIYSREKANLSGVFQEYPNFKFALQACLVGALAAFLFNDSGITSAAMILLIIVPSIGCILLSTHEDSEA